MNPLKSFLYSLPRGGAVSPQAAAGLAVSQALAYACAKDIAREVKEGWTEAQTARLMDVYLQDYGVRSYFHKSFAWFGDRSRFDGVVSLRGFLPSSRHLRPGDCFILDTAPVFKGYPADIGYSASLGGHAGLSRGREYLAKLRVIVFKLFTQAASGSGLTGGDISAAVGRHIAAAGYDIVHHRYPGAVLGHRLHAMGEGWRPPTLTPFGWRAYARFLAAGVVPDLLNEEHRGELSGAWAIEPHLGGAGFGCKFEEVLLVEDGRARWLSEEIPW